MRVLIWNCPWASQGQPMFFQNCLAEHLIPQGNTLAEKGVEVYIAYADYMSHVVVDLASTINHISLNSSMLDDIVGQGDTLTLLYSNKSAGLNRDIGKYLKPILPENIDVILTWENPVGYLELLYPNALIINQMPGAFSRAPFPHTVTFDPVGLYKHSVIADSKSILSQILTDNEKNVAENFIKRVHNALDFILPYDREELVGTADKKLKLLPLQVTAHYAFVSDSGYSSQAELLSNAMKNVKSDESVIVTQYKSSFTAETPITEKNYTALKTRWPSMLWRKEFDTLPSPSQLLLPLVDEVVSYSSSIIFQAMALGKKISIFNNSYYKDYSTKNYEDVKRNYKVISFLINRYQPAANAVRYDGDFLLSLLTEMLKRKQNGSVGADLCPSFCDIDSKYEDKYLLNFDNSKIINAIGKVNNKIIEKNAIITKFKNLVNRTNVKCISFDIFDTLITRVVENPSSIFDFVQVRAEQELLLTLIDFPRIRSWAETEARKFSSKEEISLSDIYSQIVKFYHLEATHKTQLMDIEANVECDLIIARDMGRQLWLAAKATGKTIVFTSDMYLPKNVVNRLIEKCGYSAPDHLFLSSELFKTKHTGSLYRELTTVLKIKPGNVVHIGDNKNGDILNSEAYGIRSFYLPRSIQRLRTNKLYAELFPEKIKGERSKSIIVGLIAARMFEGAPRLEETKSLFSGDPWCLGYAALGPLLVGFTQWLQKEARRDGVSDLFFLAREGYILKCVYDSLYQDQGAIPSNYLLCSRRSSRVASLVDVQSIISLSATSYQDGAILNDIFFSRFGLSLKTLSKVRLNEVGIKDIYQPLASTVEIRMWFSSICIALSTEILANAEIERNAYLSYIDSKGLNNSVQPAVIDLGWKGNMQVALSNLTKKNLKGYYYATLSGVENNIYRGGDMRAYAGSRLTSTIKHPILSYRKILELLTCHVDGSLMKMEIRENTNCPVYVPEIHMEARKKVISAVHNGILAFARDYKTFFSDYDQNALIDHTFNSKILDRYLSNPYPLDTGMFSTLFFEDTFSGAIEKSILSEGTGVWKEGETAFAMHLKHSKLSMKNSDGNSSLSQHITQEDTKTISSSILNYNIKPVGLIIKVERHLIKRFGGQKLLIKYDRNPVQFWRDSKSFSGKFMAFIKRA